MHGVKETLPNFGIKTAVVIPFVIEMTNKLIVLANTIDWEYVANAMNKFYKPNIGRPSHPVRLMVCLHILKYLYDMSDEDVIEAWRENAYWQVFTGGVNDGPLGIATCSPSSLSRFRTRVGKEGMTLIFVISVVVNAQFDPNLRSLVFQILADTTVQEKYTAFPTDHKLICDAIRILADIGKANSKRQLGLDNLLKKANLLKKIINFRKGKGAEEDKAKLLEELRDIGNKAYKTVDKYIGRRARNAFEKSLSNCLKAINQKRDDKNKIYSLIEPSVSCIAKGKPHKPYEFGSKAGIAMELLSGVILAVMSFQGNPYDGHTLEPLIEMIFELFPNMVMEAISVDLGYRGIDEVKGIEVVTPDSLKEKNLSKERKDKLEYLVKKRSSVEPAFSHMKSSYRLGRNYLRGTEGDEINLLLSAAAYNFRKFFIHVLGQDITNDDIGQKAKRKKRKSRFALD
jgi:IS5 family transposase